MAHSRPYVSAPEHQESLGFPGELVDNWQAVAIGKMGELVGKYRSLQVFLDACVKCGACTDKCHYYLGTSDPKNMPVARQDLFRKVYRRYYTFAGKHFPKLVGAEDLTQEVLDDWYTYFHQCSQCRRCSVFCPYGIDTAEISMAAVRSWTASVSVRSTATRSSPRSTSWGTIWGCRAGSGRYPGRSRGGRRGGNRGDSAFSAG